jgi:tetratricopeptide (TPR) repeat protein
MKASPLLILIALLTLAFSLSVTIAPEAAGWSQGKKTGNFLNLMFGDGRKLLAAQFFTMADVYFHSGYYPSIFDKNSGEQKEIISASHGRKETEEDEKNEDFLGKPKDWIDAFGRNFKVTQHTHLEGGNEREMLPWLRLAADLDPQKVDTYTVGAFFLRDHLNRPDQAEAFLREGLRNNPDSSEILFELGRLYHDGAHDTNRARNVWELGIQKFLRQSEQEMKDNRLIFEETAVNLAHLEDDAGNYDRAIYWFRAAQKVSLDPGALDVQIGKIQKKISAKQP